VSSLQQAKAAPPPDNVGSSVERIVRFALNENALILLVLLVVACGLLSPNFLSPQNIANLADQLPIFAILAAGQLVVILTGGIDLSVGSVLALCAFFAAALSHHGLLPAIVVPVLVGGGVGLLNGMGAAFTRVPPFIITLAMLSIARGFALQSAAWYNGGSVTGSGAAPVSASRDFGFQFVSSGNVFGLPIAALIAIAVFAGVAYILRYEPFGRHVYAVGGNESAALLLGVNVKRVKMLV
jgi:ribose/xylose/arabinose/galactoside ABC-type transport system permease subunit